MFDPACPNCRIVSGSGPLSCPAHTRADRTAKRAGADLEALAWVARIREERGWKRGGEAE